MQDVKRKGTLADDDFKSRDFKPLQEWPGQQLCLLRIQARGR